MAELNTKDGAVVSHNQSCNSRLFRVILTYVVQREEVGANTCEQCSLLEEYHCCGDFELS